MKAFLKKGELLGFETNENGKPAPYVTLNSKLAKRLGGLYSITNDLKFTKSGIDFLIDNTESELSEYIWKSTIISYGRVFASAQYRKSGLHKSNLKGLNKNTLKFHDYIIELRNNYIAHASSNFEMFPVITILSNIERKIIGISSTHIAMYGEPKEKYKSFNLLILDVLEIANQMLEKCKDKLIEECKTEDIENLYKRSILKDS